MKKYFILFLFSMAILSACSKDDNKKKGKTDPNTFSINGTEYDIDTNLGIYFESLGTSGDNLYNFQVGGVSKDNYNIGFGICWKNTVDEVAGDFMKAIAFEEAGWRFECSNIDLSANEVESIATGLLKVTLINGTTYRIEFDGTTDGGSTLTVFLEHPIVEISD